jgi:hypothetical protein
VALDQARSSGARAPRRRTALGGRARWTAQEFSLRLELPASKSPYRALVQVGGGIEIRFRFDRSSKATDSIDERNLGVVLLGISAFVSRSE